MTIKQCLLSSAVAFLIATAAGPIENYSPVTASSASNS